VSQQAFELATGDYLFEPHSGEDYTRDEGQLSCSSSVFFFLVSDVTSVIGMIQFLYVLYISYRYLWVCSFDQYLIHNDSWDEQYISS